MSPAASDDVANSPPPMSGRQSFADIDVDDPFNLRAKSAAGFYRDDLPIPRTKAAIRAQHDTAADEEAVAVPVAARDGGAAAGQRAAPLAQRSENTCSSSPRASLHSPAAAASVAVSSRDKENSATAATGDTARRIAAKRARQRNTKRTAASSHGLKGAGSVSAMGSQPQSSTAADVASQQRPHIAALLGDGVVSGLSSGSWTECVTSIASVREAAAAYLGNDRADKLTAAVAVLCDTPGLGCSNQAVWKAASEACHALLLAAPLTLPSSLVRCVVPSLLSKLTDKRTAEPAGLIALHFAEASSARVVQQCVAAFLDEQYKNARLVERALLFLSSLVSAFSLPALSVASLLSVTRTHCEHSQQPVRAAVCALLSTVYEQLGPSFRLPLLSFIAPSLHSSLKAAWDDIDASAATRQRPKQMDAPRRGRGEDSALVPVSLDALFPRVELSTALDSAVLVGLRDKQWKVRQQSIQRLMDTLEQLQHRVTMKDGAALVAGLVPLLADSNKLLAAQAMSAVRQLICDAGDGMARWRDKLIPAVLSGVVDTKKAVREQSLAALREWVGRLGVASVVRLMAKAMEAANSSGRSELIAVLLAHRTEEADWAELVPATLDCLCDKSGEVRAAAEALSEALVTHCGYNTVNAALHRLKEAYVLQLQPIVDRHRHATRDKGPDDTSEASQRALHGRTAHNNNSNNNNNPNSGTSSTDHDSHSHPQGEQNSGAAAERCVDSVAVRSGSQKTDDECGRTRKANSGKRKPQQHASGSQRVDSQQQQQQSHTAVQQHQHSSQGDDDSMCAASSARLATQATGEPSDADCHPFLGRVDLAAKQRRLLRDGKRLQNGSFREWSNEERDETAHTLSALVSPALHGHMDSADFTRLLHAVHFFSEQLSVQPQAVHAIADVLLRWLSALMGEASPKLLMAVLAFLSSLWASYGRHQQQFCEAEMQNVLPFVIERLMGHNVQRVRKDAGALLLSLASLRLFSRAKLIAALLQGLDSKNKRVVAESCECVGQLWSGAGSNQRATAATAATIAGSGSGSGSEVQLPVWNEMKRGLPQLALLLSSACDPTVRMHALSAIVSAHTAIGEQLWVVLSGHTGKPLPEKALSMIEERVKRTRMDTTAASSQPLDSAMENSCKYPPVSSPSRALTPPAAESSTPVQSTPVSSAELSAVCSPSSAATQAKSRKHSNAPTLSALNSSLASLEAMHTSLAAQQQTSAVQQLPSSDAGQLPAAAAAYGPSAVAASLSSLIPLLSTGGDSQQVSALVSLSAALEQPQACEQLVEHVHCVLAAVARTLRSGAVAASDRPAILRVSRLLCASRTCVERVGAGLSSDVCHALLAATAAELQGGGTAEDTRASANYCVQALLDGRSVMEQLGLLAPVLHASLVASSPSPYLYSLLTPFLLHWSAAARRHCFSGAVDVSSLLSWLHRLLTAVRSCEPCERCVLDCVDQLVHAAFDCAGSEQRLLALLSVYPTDSPLVARMSALRQQSLERSDELSDPSRSTSALLVRQPGQADTAVTVTVATAAAGRLNHSPAASVRLDRLLHERATADDSACALSALSYVDRFNALQQRLRQQGPQSAAIHHTADFLASHSAHATLALPASPPRRCTTGTGGGSGDDSPVNSATSSVSAIVRDTPAQTAAAVARPGGSSALDHSSHLAAGPVPSASSYSAVFEAMRARMMKARLDTANHSLAASNSHTSGATAEEANLSLSALLAASPPPLAPHTTAVAAAAAGCRGVGGSSGSVSVSVVSGSGGSVSVSGSSGGSGSNAVSALRARLAAIHSAAANRRMGSNDTAAVANAH